MMFSLFYAPIPADDQDVTQWRNYLSFTWEKNKCSGVIQ